MYWRAKHYESIKKTKPTRLHGGKFFYENLHVCQTGNAFRELLFSESVDKFPGRPQQTFVLRTTSRVFTINFARESSRRTCSVLNSFFSFANANVSSPTQQNDIL